jgi:tripartite-type tricarboxylate transporter receptor subunit TctC
MATSGEMPHDRRAAHGSNKNDHSRGECRNRTAWRTIPPTTREEIMRKPYRYVACAAGLAASTALGLASAPATGAESFFKDRTVTVVVPVGSGGTFHIYAQIVSRHIGKHIPGKPSVILQNRPGAGGATSAAYLANAAPRDGTVIGKIVPGMLTYPLVNSSANYDATKFQYLGAIAARDYAIAVWHTTPVRTWEDLKKHEVIFGSTGRASSATVVPLFLNGVLGTKIKVVSGYKSGGDLNLAMERGETTGRGNFYSGFEAVVPQFLTEKKIRIVLTLGPRNPKTAHVPRVRDLLKPGSKEIKTFDLLETSFNQGQAFYLAEGVPKARVQTLRKAFAAAMADPALIAEARQRKVDYNPISGEDLEKLVADGMKGAEEPEVLQMFRELMGAKS